MWLPCRQRAHVSSLPRYCCIWSTSPLLFSGVWEAQGALSCRWFPEGLSNGHGLDSQLSLQGWTAQKWLCRLFWDFYLSNEAMFSLKHPSNILRCWSESLLTQRGKESTQQTFHLIHGHRKKNSLPLCHLKQISLQTPCPSFPLIFFSLSLLLTPP